MMAPKEIQSMRKHMNKGHVFINQKIKKKSIEHFSETQTSKRTLTTNRSNKRIFLSKYTVLISLKWEKRTRNSENPKKLDLFCFHI